ncbi:MAG: hypothetical protein ACRDSK_14300 [Actinophytocola sp.]|uniref:hypothetical protein n=1 Tax=Actinophytocola sp. TaxID=1872138 RepID=UPI003D6A8C78
MWRAQRLRGLPDREAFSEAEWPNLPLDEELDELVRSYLTTRSAMVGASRPSGSPVRLVSVRLVSAAARIIPVAERARYREEFEAELVELAGAGRLRRLRHAVRVLVRAVPLRWELRRRLRGRAR